jgi:ATP-dependent DNA helicase RecQ
MDYIPNPEKAQITFLRARQKTDYLSISDQNLKDRYHDLQKRIESVVSYVENKGECRSSFLLRYFGETNTTDCGHCDVCRAKNTRPLDMDKLIQEIKTTLGAFESLSLDELAQKLQLKNKDLMPALRWLIDNKTIKEVNNRLMLF